MGFVFWAISENKKSPPGAVSVTSLLGAVSSGINTLDYKLTATGAAAYQNIKKALHAGASEYKKPLQEQSL